MEEKLLLKSSYNNYFYEIYGWYTDEYRDYLYGKLNSDNIGTRLIILNYLGDIVFDEDWLSINPRDDNMEYRYLIRNRVVYKRKWWQINEHVEGVVHIEEDYERTIKDLIKLAEKEIDKISTKEEKDQLHQQITDELPYSLFKKYQDYKN